MLYCICVCDIFCVQTFFVRPHGMHDQDLGTSARLGWFTPLVWSVGFNGNTRPGKVTKSD